jgi:hypothetical protein
MNWASAPSILRIMPPEMRVRFNAVAGERQVWSLTGNTLFPLSTTTQPLMTYFAIGTDNRGRWRTLCHGKVLSSQRSWTTVDVGEGAVVNPVCATIQSSVLPPAPTTIHDI